MKAILNCVKSNMRRLLAFSLACLTAASALAVFTAPVSAASADEMQTLYKWTRVQSKTELEAIKGKNVPVLLCWEDPLAERRYVAQGRDSKDAASGESFYRDGRHGGNDWYAYMPDEMEEAYKEYFKKNLRSGSGSFESDLAVNGGWEYNLKSFYNNVVAKSKEPWASSPACLRFWTDFLRDNQTVIGHWKGKSLDTMPEVAYDADTFYTEKNVSNWTMDVGNDVTNGKVKVNFKSDGMYLGYGPAIREYNNKRLDWTDSKIKKGAHNMSQVIDFELCPADCGDKRSKYTDEGKVQLVCDIGSTSAKCGLCFDDNRFDLLFNDEDFYSSYLDVTRKNHSNDECYFSNFTLFYGEQTKIQLLKGDYTVQKGEILNADENLRIAPGARLLVEPGGTITVTGVLVNDGVIDNCGTVVVNEKSSIVSSLVNASNPSKDKEAGTISCYGGTASFSGTFYRQYVKKATEEYEKELKEKRDAADALLSEYSAAWENLKYWMGIYNNAVSSGNQSMINTAYGHYQTAEENYNAVAERYEPLNEAAINYEESRDKIIRDKIAAYKTGDEKTEYTDCAGDLIILKKGGIYMSNNPNCMVNIYGGGTFLNLGTLVTTNGMNVDGGEVRNKKGAYIFSGCYMSKSIASAVSVRGSGASSTIIGMEKTKAGACSYGYSDYYLENEGTILIQGSSKFTNSDTHVSGSGMLETYNG